ncbi:MAG: hypothetical protein RMK92_02750 [Armatimonadota bacterium]|nr:hypothetical protein [Armatimonadota bacterium]
MANLKEGDRVQIVVREQTSSDVKERSYYPYMGGLRGTIYRLYSDGRAAVQIDLDSLPEAVLTRHTEVQERMKTRWIESLSEEARSRLTPEEREFHLNYVLLVRVEDLQPEGKRTRTAQTTAAKEPARSDDTLAPPTARARRAPSAKAESPSLFDAGETAPKRKTLEEIEKAEEEFLKSRQQRRR